MKESFILYRDQYEPIKSLTIEQKGYLFEAIFSYQFGEEPVFNDPVVSMAFGFFKQTFDRDRAKYLKKCNKNKENVNKRWSKKDTNVYERIRVDTNHTDSGSDTDTDTDTESDSDKKKKKKKKKEVVIYPEWLDLKLWADFQNHRKAIKARMTPQAERLNINKLQVLTSEGYEQTDVINESIANGWKSLFAPNNVEKKVDIGNF